MTEHARSSSSTLWRISFSQCAKEGLSMSRIFLRYMRSCVRARRRHVPRLRRLSQMCARLCRLIILMMLTLLPSIQRSIRSNSELQYMNKKRWLIGHLFCLSYLSYSTFALTSAIVFTYSITLSLMVSAL